MVAVHDVRALRITTETSLAAFGGSARGTSVWIFDET
jgi:hypothetical protein